jgi:hypothetical protein
MGRTTALIRGSITRTTKTKEEQEGVVSEEDVAILYLLSRYGRLDLKLNR